MLIDREAYYEVQTILNSKMVNSTKYYLIKWKGFSQQQSTWEPEEHIAHLQLDIDIYNQKKKQKDLLKKKQKDTLKKKQKIQKKGKKSNKEKIKEYLTTHQRQTYLSQQSESKDIYSKEHQTQKYAGKNIEQTLQNYRYQHSTVVVFDKAIEEMRGVVFKVQKENITYQLSEKQTKMLYPFELSCFYEQEVKQILFGKSLSLE